MKCAIGLDLGGTNIKGLAVTTQGKVLAEETKPTGDDGTPGWKRNVKRVLQDLRERLPHEPDFIGVAAPGLAARNHRSIAFMPERLPGLEGLDWQRYLGVSHPVPVLNDAQAALLGEVWCGAAKGSKNVVLLTLGTGVGGAAMVDGHPLHGRIGRAGHFGHMSLNSKGPPDITGTPGSLEDLIGDATLQKRSRGCFASTRDLVVASRRGDPEARKVWLSSVRALAAGITSLINALDPEVVILGGGIVQAGPALLQPLGKFLDDFEWRPGGVKVRIIRAKLGDRAGAFGAACRAIQARDSKVL
jgi:glucokinase